MHIERIISQNRRDFTAIYTCEHCGHTHEGNGYDDSHFHQKVVPAMNCPSCGKVADGTYRPLTTKHPDGQVV